MRNVLLSGMHLLKVIWWRNQFYTCIHTRHHRSTFHSPILLKMLPEEKHLSMRVLYYNSYFSQVLNISCFFRKKPIIVSKKNPTFVCFQETLFVFSHFSGNSLFFDHENFSNSSNSQIFTIVQLATKCNKRTSCVHDYPPTNFELEKKPRQSVSNKKRLLIYRMVGNFWFYYSSLLLVKPLLVFGFDQPAGWIIEK